MCDSRTTTGAPIERCLMTSGFKKKWAGNSGANILGGASTALLSFVLPAILARWMSKMEFSLWSLAFQIVAYVSVFGYGLNSAVSKYVSEKKDADEIGRILKAAARIMSIASGLGFVFICLAALLSGYVFSEIPSDMQWSFRTAVCMLGLSALVQNVGLIPVGYFTGKYKNIDFVLPQMIGKASIFLAMCIALFVGAGMVALSAVYCAASVVPVYLLWKKMQGERQNGEAGSHHGQSATEVTLLNRYCAGLLVWSLSMLLVNAVDTILVGYVDVKEVGAYAIALTYVTILGGVINAVISPVIPIASAMYADQHEKLALPRLLHRVTLINSVAMNAILLLTIVFGRNLLNIWVGSAYVEATYSYLIVLTCANCVRYLCMPYATMLMGTALHRVTFLSALMEGGGNFIFSVIFAYYFGVIGIAYGTLAGALLGVFVHFLINFKKTEDLTPSARVAILKGYVLPIALFVPVYFLIYIKSH